jgi:glycosyltransferase involved in cell wall biosynthesis
MSGTRTEGELIVSGPIRGWADIVAAYRPAVMKTEKRSARGPKVSVCIVANQAARHLQATIDSVLAQRMHDLEIVVIGDESSDVAPNIGATANDDRVRVIRNTATVPLVAGFNMAVGHSRGQFVKLLCPDDTLRPHCIAAQARVLEENRGVALVAAGTDYIDHTGQAGSRRPGFARIVGIHSAQHVITRIVRSGGNPIGLAPGAMFRREDFQRCGGFRENLLEWPELELWTRLLRCGEFFGMPATLASVRARHSSMSVSASMLLQLAERIEFTRRLINDPVWTVSATDRVVGQVKCGINMLRGHRYGLPGPPSEYRSTAADSLADRREFGDR